jgi:general secretion pathway protein F
MPTYRYVALTTDGSRCAGSLVGEDEKSAIRQLRSQGLFPTEVHTEGAGAGGEAREEVPVGLFHRVKQDQLATFSRQLADLVKAGLPVLRSLQAVTEHTDNPLLVKVLEKVTTDVSGGCSIAEALAKHPKVFPTVYVSMVRAGEASGQLSEILNRLAELQESERAQRGQIVSSLTYPIMLVIVGTIAVSLLVTFLIPRFKKIFEDLGRTLPAPTRALIGISDFVGTYWWAIIIGLVGAVLLFRIWHATPSGRLVVDRFRLRNRIFGRLTQRVVVARFARTFGTLLHGGVDVLSAFTVVRDVVGNEVVARALDDCRTKVREGDTIHSPLAESGHFPSIVIHMVALGEETGDMEGVLNSVANTFDREVQNAVRMAMSLLEPLIIISLGGIVFFIISAMLLPIFQLNVSGSA